MIRETINILERYKNNEWISEKEVQEQIDELKKLQETLESDSLASDGWEMIESAMRDW